MNYKIINLYFKFGLIEWHGTDTFIISLKHFYFLSFVY